MIVCIVIGVSATLGIDDFVPRVLLAGILVIGVVCAIIDCEVKSVGVGAS